MKTVEALKSETFQNCFEAALNIIFRLSLTASSVQAQFTEVHISSNVNVNLQNYTHGTNYPLGRISAKCQWSSIHISEIDQ